MPTTQVSAHISQETKARLERFVRRTGQTRGRVIEDAQGRLALWERLQFSLDGEPDPWHEPAKAGVDLRQFHPLPGAPSGAGIEHQRAGERVVS